MTLKRRRWRRIENEEINANAPLDSFTLTKMKENQEFASSSATGLGFTLKDLDDKELMASRMLYTHQSGAMGGVNYSDTAESSSGRGAIVLTGQDFYVTEDELYPVSPLLGIGGFIIARCTGSANLSFGLQAYDHDDNQIVGGERWFIANGATLSNSYQIWQGVCRDYGSGQDQFATGTKYFLPIIASNTNNAEVHIDSYGIFTLNYAKGALFQ